MDILIEQIQDNINLFVDEIKIQLEQYVSKLAIAFADSLKTQIFDGIAERINNTELKLQQKPQSIAQQNTIQTTNFNLLRSEIQDLRFRMKEIGEVNARALIEVSEELERRKDNNGQKQFKELDQRIRQLEWKIEEIKRNGK
ncbi:hypothetical protein SS50377_24933 [Spironucleus salmonicida]|uniref:Uncharacterized protein n=1 Tax=Spironucleus salmonicida TaxID=348837 RepID=V6LRQ4_9EUKA|nr:hypothetical protein SS50377_24933 [Spironucleus salmonicida]|eukprot:EST43464.1 Hypothetical protein SS50377_16828 [Spironucleus salmonicida]